MICQQRLCCVFLSVSVNPKMAHFHGKPLGRMGENKRGALRLPSSCGAPAKRVGDPRLVQRPWQVGMTDTHAALLLRPWLAPSGSRRTFKNVSRCNSCTVYNSVGFSIQARLNPQRTILEYNENFGFYMQLPCFYQFPFPLWVSSPWFPYKFLLTKLLVGLKDLMWHLFYIF